MATRAKELSDLGNSGHLNVHDDGTVTLEGGNVGIGDPTPTEGKLVVRGDANTNGLFVGGNSTTGQSYGALINAGTNSSDANFRLYDQSGSTPYLFVRGDGNVSINTATPDIFNFRIATDSILSGSDYSWPFDITRAGQTNSRGFSIGQQIGSGVTALGNHNGDMALGHTYGADSNGQPIFYETMRIEHIDQDVGRVGIGITTPTVKLDVRSSEDPSDGTIVFLRNEVASGNGAFIRYDVNNVGDWAIGIPDNRNAFTIWKDSGNTGTEYFTVNSNGNVGIGTNNPARQLSIVDDGTNGQAIMEVLDSTNNNVSGIFLGRANNTNIGGMRYFHATDHLALRSNDVDALIINSTGNVGIGTDTPDRKLHVKSTSSSVVKFETSSSSYAGVELKNISGVADGSPAGYLYGYNSSQFLGGIKFVKKDSNSGQIVLRQQVNSTNTDVVNISDGNVGIGNVLPAHPIHIYEDGGYYASIGRGNSTPGGSDPWLGLFNNTDIANATFGWGIYDSNANGSFQIWNKNNNTTGYDALTILRGGNVGIGTDNPSHKLEVFGTATDGTELLHIKSNGNVADGGYHWMTSAIAGSQTTNANIVHMIGKELASKNSGYFGFHYAGDHSNDNFITIGGYAADQLLNIKMNGNVGIGTTSPDYTLVVGNNSTYHTLKVQGINANLAATVKFKHHGGGGRTGIDPEWNISRGSYETSFNTGVTSGNALVGGLAFWNNTIGGSNVDAMRLKDNGDAIFGYNVGIGITNPSAKLHTRETVSNTISAATAGVKFDGSGGDGLAFGNMQSSPYSSWIQAGYLADGYNPAFNNGYPISLNPVGGNVGIGITSPSEKLHVSGNILATGTVNASSDISLKDNITSIPNAIDKVLQIRGVTFNRNDIEDNPRQAGVIAQEVEKVLPEVVSEDKDGIKSVAYGNMVSLLIEAIKEQQGQINMLKEKLENK